MRWGISIAFALAACSSPGYEPPVHEPPEYEPLVCDPEASDRLVFGYHLSDAFFGPYAPHGEQLLLVDGSCRYYVHSRDTWGGVLASGSLNEEQLDAINDELMTASWTEIGGLVFEPEGAADGPTSTIWRDDLSVICRQAPYCGAPDEILSLFGVAGRWTEALAANAELLDGPVDVDGQRVDYITDPTFGIEWTGTTDLASSFALREPSRIRVEDPGDVVLLRSLRDAQSYCCGAPATLRQGDVVLEIGVADVLPYDIALTTTREHLW